MDGSADAMAAQRFHHVETGTADFSLYGTAYFIHTISSASRFRSAPKCILRTTSQRVGLRRHVSNSHGHGGIGDETVLLSYQIQFHEITMLQNAITRNAVDRFIVHADAHSSGKSIHLRGRWFSAELGKGSRTNRIEFGCGDAGLNCRRHGIQCNSYDASAPFQPFQFRMRLNGHTSYLYLLAACKYRLVMFNHWKRIIKVMQQ